MSNIDKRALREAAEKATPGRWEYYPGNTSIEYNVDSMDEDQGSIVYVDSGDFTQKQTDLNGTFIAAANPATVLPLLDELEADKEQIKTLESRNRRLEGIINAAERRIAEQSSQKRLIGWRASDYTDETADPELAKNWAAAIGVLPIFDGDVNTKLGAAGIGEGE
ncbi:ead/Ea22-like family protein [Citrobacter koseri]|nr:ead/Ea22-like family protein [Citrobacter koseri]